MIILSKQVSSKIQHTHIHISNYFISGEEYSQKLSQNILLHCPLERLAASVSCLLITLILEKEQKSISKVSFQAVNSRIFLPMLFSSKRVEGYQYGIPWSHPCPKPQEQKQSYRLPLFNQYPEIRKRPMYISWLFLTVLFSHLNTTTFFLWTPPDKGSLLSLRYKGIQ